MKNFKIILCIILLTSLVAACNTVHGFGKDLGKLGDKIESKSER